MRIQENLVWAQRNFLLLTDTIENVLNPTNYSKTGISVRISHFLVFVALAALLQRYVYKVKIDM
jgi:hypothetical protein